MLIDLTQEEVDLILNQLESLEKALAKVQRSKRLMRAYDRRDLLRTEALLSSLKDKAEKVKTESILEGGRN
jgi:hypothetical protein